MVWITLVGFSDASGIQKSTVLDKAFVTLTFLYIGHFRQQYKLIAEMRSTCPKLAIVGLSWEMCAIGFFNIEYDYCSLQGKMQICLWLWRILCRIIGGS